MHRSFLVQAKYRSETRLFEAATWQPDENNPAQEESIHVIMRTHVACVKIKPYSSPAACSSASVHHRYGTDSARNAGEVPRISHAPQIGETQDAEVWCAVSPPPHPRPENHVYENAVDVYAPDNNNNNNNPRNSLSISRFWEYAVLSL